jgi:hypothetical protein
VNTGLPDGPLGVGPSCEPRRRWKQWLEKKLKHRIATITTWLRPHTAHAGLLHVLFYTAAFGKRPRALCRVRDRECFLGGARLPESLASSSASASIGACTVHTHKSATTIHVYPRSLALGLAPRHVLLHSSSLTAPYVQRGVACRRSLGCVWRRTRVASRMYVSARPRCEHPAV